MSATPAVDARGVPIVRIGDPAGPYRRRIVVVATGPGVVEGGLEDDFHDFRVTLRHDRGTISRVDVESVRWPWSTCPGAATALASLAGTPLSDRCTAIAEVVDPRMACTHQFDLAGLAVAHAARRVAGRETRRTYDITVGPPRTEVVTARLRRDSEPLLRWTLRWAGGGRALVDPSPPFHEAPMRGGFIRWAAAALDPDTAEAAIVLRRACDIALGRTMDLEAFPTAADIPHAMTGICFSMQPAVMPVALRNRGSIRDFADHPDALLADLAPE